MTDLKPCPFCGGKAGLYRVDYHGYKVICLMCGMQTLSYEFKENAIAKWDGRAEVTNALIQQLEERCKHLNKLRDAAADRALKMEERVHQLEAERDAAVEDMESMADYVIDDVCEWCGNAKYCKAPCNFKWRGVQKEGT